MRNQLCVIHTETDGDAGEWGLVVVVDAVCGGCSLVLRKFSPYYFIEFVMGDIPQSNLKR